MHAYKGWRFLLIHNHQNHLEPNGLVCFDAVFLKLVLWKQCRGGFSSICYQFAYWSFLAFRWVPPINPITWIDQASSGKQHLRSPEHASSCFYLFPQQHCPTSPKDSTSLSSLNLQILLRLRPLARHGAYEMDHPTLNAYYLWLAVVPPLWVVARWTIDWRVIHIWCHSPLCRSHEMQFHPVGHWVFSAGLPLNWFTRFWSNRQHKRSGASVRRCCSSKKSGFRYGPTQKKTTKVSSVPGFEYLEKTWLLDAPWCSLATLGYINQ